MPYRPRNARDAERIRRARSAAQAQGNAAIDVAVAHIGAAFDAAASVNAFKMRVEHLLRRGTHDPALRARFGARGALLAGSTLDIAVGMIECWWREERNALSLARALGYGNALSLDILRELRLILRLMRFKRMDADFCRIIMALCDQPAAMAAE